MTQASTKHHDLTALDDLTGGAFTAPTSGERATRIREWLARDPVTEQMQAVFKELSGRDKGAAKPVRERLDEIKRARGQETAAAEWALKAQTLLDVGKLNLADAMAWQRDAAKAGAPLSREPLATLRNNLAERVKGIEDLQNRVQVQREAAVLLAQRIEVLSTKPWRDACAALDGLKADVGQWQAQAEQLSADASWPSVDVRFPPLLEASRVQLQVVWDAFEAAAAQAQAAATDPAAPLPPVPVWAAELRESRGVSAPSQDPRPHRPTVPPEVRAGANDAVRAALAALERQVAEGHGKASAGAAGALRGALKEHGRLVDTALENQAHAALSKAGELEGWQRWRADQLREELVSKAEGLLERVAKAQPAKLEADQAAPAAGARPVEETADAETADAEPETLAPPDPHVTASESESHLAPESTATDAGTAGPPVQQKPRMGGRKLQETLRSLREQWKQVDQGGAPNHALWKRFDEACTEAHKFVEVWLEKVRADAAAHRANRIALIEELNAWALENRSAKDDDWKGFARILRQFGDRWRESGHLNEKAFAELQPQWKEAMHSAAAPLENLQKESVQRRRTMIDEAGVLGAEPVLRIDAVKSLQQRWQAEAQGVPLDRKFEQKLWDSFRKPIDDAFNRKTAEREKAAAAEGRHDRLVLNASKALEAANASGDAQAIRSAMAALDAALRGQAAEIAENSANAAAEASKTPSGSSSEQDNESNAPDALVLSSSNATSNVANETPLEVASQTPPEVSAADTKTDRGPATSPDDALPAAEIEAASDAAADAQSPTGESSAETAETAETAAAEPPKPAARPVVAVRGDDRPGMKKAQPGGLQGRGGKFGDRRDGKGGPPGGGRPGGRDAGDRSSERPGGRFAGRSDPADRGPRLGDAAFRAQREALEHAQRTLRNLAAQAHGEALTELLSAWEQRDVEKVPGAQQLGPRVSSATRSGWVAAIGGPARAKPDELSTALLRLEMAAEAPTPAEHVAARRMLQLQLLTRRNDAGPAETWGEDAGKVLSSNHDEANARRLQIALKTLLRP